MKMIHSPAQRHAPNAEASEMKVIGAASVDRNFCEFCLNHLDVDDFYFERHRRAFVNIENAHHLGGFEEVKKRMRELSDEAELLVAVEFMRGYVANCPDYLVEHMQRDIEKLKTHSRARRAVVTLGQAQEEIWNNPEHAVELLHKAINDLTDLVSTNHLN